MMRNSWFALPQMLTMVPWQTVTPTGSPFVFTIPRDGALVVTGGTVSLLEYGRGGSYVSLGFVAGISPVARGDTVRTTYVVAPTMRFIPQ